MNVGSLPNRIVVFDHDGRSQVVAHGTPSNVVVDPARPGFQMACYWATDGAPVRLVQPDHLEFEPTLEPSRQGALLRVLTLPPEGSSVDQVSPADVAAHFAACGTPSASTYAPSAPHPYMQRTQTVDVCLIIEGEVTLVLDTEEVDLKAGDTVLQRATNHAWSNRSSSPCVIVISSHDARQDG